MYKLLQGDCLDIVKTLETNSVQCVITSPPYYGLRDYGTAKWKGGDSDCKHMIIDSPGPNAEAIRRTGYHHPVKDVCPHCGAIRIDDQIGLEQTPELYVNKLVTLFREIRRVLKDDGTVWLNLGDSFWGSGKSNGQHELKDGVSDIQKNHRIWKDIPQLPNPSLQKSDIYKSKDLIGIPWMVAFALRNDGWYLRSDIIWAKRNCMPESVKDRPTRSHEYIFLLSKNKKYYYDNEAIKEPVAEVSLKRAEYGWNCDRPSTKNGSIHTEKMGTQFVNPSGRNKRDVWWVSTKPFKEAHFATFPEDLILPCVLAGTSEKGQCPKCGKNWVRITERKEGENQEWAQSNNQTNRDFELRGVTTKRKLNRGSKEDYYANSAKQVTIGWQPNCECDGHFEKVDDNITDNNGDILYPGKKKIYVPDREPGEPLPNIILDPFSGAGTTGVVAVKNGRDYIGIELNPDYIKMSKNRIDKLND